MHVFAVEMQNGVPEPETLEPKPKTPLKLLVMSRTQLTASGPSLRNIQGLLASEETKHEPVLRL